MAQSQNTVREVFVATALASETTLKDFDATASDGEIGVFNADGSDGDTQGKFLIAIKIDGKTITSDLYSDEQVKSAKNLAGVPQALRNIVVKPVTTTAGDEIIVAIRTLNYGSLSVENFYEKYGQYVVKTGDGQEAIVDGLIASLNKNFSREPGASASLNPYYSFLKGHTVGDLTVDTAPDTDGNATVTINGVDYTVALLAVDDADAAATKIAAVIDGEAEYSAAAVGAVVTITSATDADAIFSVSYDGGATNSVATYVGTAANAVLGIEEKVQELDLGRLEGRPLEFEVFVDENDDDSLAVISVAEAGYAGKFTGRQVALAEYFYRGNRGDAFRKQHFPYNWSTKTKTLADPTAQYSGIEMSLIRKQDEEFQVATSRKHVSIFVPDGTAGSVYTAINAIKDKIDAVTGLTLGSLSE